MYVQGDNNRCYIQNKRLSLLCNVLACQQLLSREEGVGGVGLLPFLLPTLSPTESPCIKIKAVFVKQGLPIQRLTVENSPSISARTRLCSSYEPKAMFTTTNDLHKFFTIRAIVPAAYRPQEMKSIPIL